MLSYLAVKNFAIIENIEVTFEAGFTVITGETGAGKSLLIDAIGLLLGDRASSDVVRTGEDRCEVTGLFNQLNEPIKAMCDSLGIDTRDDELLIKRTISASSNNIIKCNNQTITLQDLRSITVYLADIHTQHDTKRLINPDMYIHLLDDFNDDIKTLKTFYQAKREDYLGAIKAYEKLQKEKDTMLEKMDFMRFQRDEIEKESLVRGEEEAVEIRLQTLENFDKIFSSIKLAYEHLNDQGAIDNIYAASQQLESIESFDSEAKELKERCESAYYELDDVKASLHSMQSNLDFDPSELDTLQARKHTFETLKRKYRRDIDAIIDFAETLSKDLESYEDYDTTLKEREADVKKTYATLSKASDELFTKRKETAKKIEEVLIKHLDDLALPQTRFSVALTKHEADDCFDKHVFLEHGQESIDFLLSTNIGEPLKPLSKVASGGELSRIMLGLKAILTAHGILGLIIFDEIDTGVSGYVASQVAKKMLTISRSLQVLAITHLPQVAAKGEHHAFIYKETDKEKTKAMFKQLSYEERIKEIASMMSSDAVSDSARESAKELLSKA